MLLIHGIGSTWRVWTPILDRLEQRYDVLAISLPGYGESPPLDEEPSVPALTAAVEQELDAVGWDSPHIVGNSLGGWIAAEVAAHGRARSVVALDPAGLFTPRELLYSRITLRQSYFSAQRLAPAAPRLMRNPLLRQLAFGQVQTRGWRNDPEEAAYAIWAMGNSPSFLKTFDWIVRNKAQPRGLDAIDCPFLVAWGTWDFLLFPRMAKRWVDLVPGAELELLPRLGHVPMADDPERTAEVIEEFAARAARQSRGRRAAAPA